VRGEPHLLATARYIELNPVAAGLCTAPEDWPWTETTDELRALLADYNYQR